VDAIGRRRAAGGDAEAATWAGKLEPVIADLDRLNHETEQDFLKIGEKLTEFIAAVRLISSELGVLTNLISGEHGLRAAEALTRALDRSRDMQSRAEEGAGTLNRLREEAGQLKQTLSGFKGTVSTFRTLGVLTRIETARLGSAGADFGNLADDVKSLAGNVQTRVDGALDTAGLLLGPIESAMQNISALEEGQVKDLPSVVAAVLASLSSFRDIQNRAHESSVRLQARYGAIADAFGKLIVSIQFHDITRQQVEHVIEALDRLRSASGGTGGGVSHCPPDAAAILALESSQLADAGEKFAASVASVGRSLDEIAALVREMADESRTLSGLSEDEKNSFFLEMERGCTAILGSLSHCASAEAATQASSDGLAETIAQMRGSIDEIQAVEIHMRRMALNASIRAAHIGAPGDALGVLAGSLQDLAADCGQRAGLLVEALGSINDAATRLSGHGGPAITTEGDGSVEDMRTAAVELHSSSERSFAQIAQVIARGAHLREELLATRDSFSVGVLFAETVGRARGMLNKIKEDDPCVSLRQGSERAERDLADFARHYTMQAERDVHEGVANAVAGVANAAARAEREETPAETGELGDNVELF
jgi:methyl-accepting chemotaxis protein